MAIEIKFTCNICLTSYNRTDGKAKIPIGWGAVRPTLRVNAPSYGDADTKEKKDQWRKIQDVRDTLKKKLWEKEYHLCQDCLLTAQSTVLQIESEKKQRSA